MPKLLARVTRVDEHHGPRAAHATRGLEVPMQIAVISDLHLGAGGAADGFGHDDAEFLRFLRHLEQNFEKVVLLGDIWETLTGRLPGDPGAELRAAHAAHPEISARFAGKQYLYVHGNHDLVAGATDGVPDELVLRADGVRLLFTHGHQNDALIQKRRWMSELGIWLGGWIRRLGMGALYRMFAALDERRSGVSSDSASCPFQRWAMDLAVSREADVVITGHTHLAMRAEHGSRLFLNSGACSEGNVSFLSLDTRRGCYGVHAGW